MNVVLTELDKNGAETQEALERFLDDEEMYLKYVRDFPDEPTMGLLKKAVEADDYDAAEKAVHALKGIANNLGFVPLADAAVDMLEELREQNIHATLEAYEDVRKQYKVFCNTIRTWRGES